MIWKQIINEITQDVNQKIQQVIKEIEGNKDLKNLVDHTRPEVYKYKGKFGVLVVLKEKLTNEDEKIVTDYIRNNIAKKYGARIEHNGLIIKILFKELQNVER